VPPTDNSGVEVVIEDLGFGRCKLQVQVPERSASGAGIQKPEELVGKNIVTSFTRLAEAYFRDLEAKEHAGKGDVYANGVNGKVGQRPLRTKIRYVGGSVEAACALGVADGIVDLVGTSPFSIRRKIINN